MATSLETRNAIVAATSLSKKFGSLTAVDDVSFTVPQGEIVGFVGPNGAGKTTTIGMLMGFLRASKGGVKLFGDTVSPANAHRHHAQIGYIAGDMALLDNLTGAQYIAHMAALTRINKSHQKELIATIQPVLNKRITQLSRGNKQKIALIAALQHRPKLLLLDEPTSGLDPLMQETFLQLITHEARDGATVFMSSHILSEVATSCQRIMFMKHGRIILDSSVEALESSSGQEITISATKTVLTAMFRRHPVGLSKPSYAGGSVQCLYQGDTNTLLKWLAGHKLTSVSIHDRNLDSIFHDMYKNQEVKS